MDRAERIGLGVAIGAHLVLFAMLSFGLVPRDNPQRETVAVTLTDEVGAIATASDLPAPASQSQEFEPSPLPTPTSDEPIPQPRVEPTPPPPRPSPTRSERRPEPARPQRESRPDPRPRRRPDSRLDGITEGISPNATGTSASTAQLSASDMSALEDRIRRIWRDCYNLGSLSGTAAEDIRIRLRVQPSRDGRVTAGQVEVIDRSGLNDSNRNYARQMAEVARNAVLNPRCRLNGLPDRFYDRGWSDIKFWFIPGELT